MDMVVTGTEGGCALIDELRIVMVSGIEMASMYGVDN